MKKNFKFSTIFSTVISIVLILFGKEISAQIYFTHVTDQPVFSYGASGEWDDGTVWNPAIIKDGDTLRMWYTGLDASVWQTSMGKIGYAWSLDGIEWHRFAGNPVLSGELSWEASSVYGCAVIKDGDTFKMWYGAGGTPSTKVGYATSEDGKTWSKHPDPVLQVGPYPSWDHSLIAPYTVVKEDTIYKMWYWAGKAGFPGESSMPQTGLATSTDGINWIKYDDPSTTEPEFLSSDPVLKVGDSGEWDEIRAIDPMVLPTDSGYEMWYLGVKPPVDVLGRQLVGYATSTDGITWIKCPINPIIYTDPVWGYCYYGGTVLKFNDKYHLWYACFHSPPTQARPQIGYAVSSINNIYPENVFIDKYYAKKNIDSILFTTRLSNAGNHQFTAHLICFNSDSTQIDSLALFDDGFHGDSLSNDGLFGVYIPPRTIEDYFTLSLSIFDHQNNEYYLTPDLSRFTTAGPVVVDSIYVTYNSFVKAYYVKLFLKNEGNTFTIPYSTVQLSSDDLWITSISPSQSLPEILPGVIVSSGNFYVRVDSTFPGQFNFNFLVSVDGWPYWSDSAKVIVTGIEDEKQVPLTFRLEQNFPNPFNSFSVIKYSIPNSSKVIIKVFDVLGTEIETLINEEKPLGTYELNWNAANLPSGVYFYRLQAGDFVQTRKMILLK